MKKLTNVLHIIFILVLCCGMFMLISKNYQLQSKVDFYEKVIEDFGIDEFIHYPELYYNEDYVEQAKVHNCMWAIDESIEWSNKYYECEKELLDY